MDLTTVYPASSIYFWLQVQVVILHSAVYWALIPAIRYQIEVYIYQGCHRSGNGQGKKFFKVWERSGNFIWSGGKIKFWRKVRENWNNLIQLIWYHWGLEETFGVWSQQICSLNMKKENLLKTITLNDQVEEEATTRSDILHFFGQGNFIFSRKKSAGILKRHACGNHVYMYFYVPIK